jgi:hypothetical protein
MQEENWFDAPAFAQAWWQEKKIRLLLCFHQDGAMKIGKVRQRHSQDTDPNLSCFGWRPVRPGKAERFLSVLVPHLSEEEPRQLAAAIETRVSESGDCTARIEGTKISIKADGTWAVLRGEKE